MCFCGIFLFKQKTVYEMRSSDWSSDVCPSDLEAGEEVEMLLARRLDGGAARRGGHSLNALAQFRVVALQPAQHLQEPVTGRARQKLCQQGIPASAQTVFLSNLSMRSNTTQARLSPNLLPGLAATLRRRNER